MATRIRIAELPSRRSAGDHLQWVLTWQAGERGSSLAVPEGESVVGSSDRSTLRLSAPGVAAVHFHIRREADRVYVRPSGRAAVRVNGTAIRALTPVEPGYRLVFGEVTAYLERIAPEDQEPAVSIRPAARGIVVEDGAVQDFRAWQINRLTGVLADCRYAPAAAASRLAAALAELTGAAGIAIYAAPPDRPAEWALLGEARGSMEWVAIDPESTACGQYRLATAERNLLLTGGFPDSEMDCWRDALCRHVLALAALAPGGAPQDRKRRSTEQSDSPDPWHELAGETIRRRLASCAAMCLYCDTVLVLGETGTGKELAARGLHRLWKRKGPFVGINCAAIPSDLLDAELFGIEGGTATGVTARRGRIEQAGGGTLFLDEVADLPISLQTKLLRVLQEREYYSVGGSALRRADVHIVAATNRAAADLRGAHMRADLYFRLSQATILLPPLRDRLEDLPALCAGFLTQMEQRFARGIPGLSVAALTALRAYSWPGNVRELQNVLRGMYASAPSGRVMGSAQVPHELRSEPLPVPEGKLTDAVEDTTRRTIAAELQRSGSVPAAARALGLSEGYLYRKIKRLGLAPPRS